MKESIFQDGVPIRKIRFLIIYILTESILKDLVKSIFSLYPALGICNTLGGKKGYSTKVHSRWTCDLG